MPERWEVEVRKLKDVQPPVDLWDRVTLGPRPATQGKPRPRWLGWVAPLAAGVAVIAAVAVATSISGAIHRSGPAADRPSDETVYAVYDPAWDKPGKYGFTVIIPLRAGTAGPPIRVGQFSDAAITPDGKTIYAANNAGVVPIRTATGTAGAPIRGTGGVGGQIAIDPNGKIAYRTIIFPRDAIIPINLATDTVGKPIHLGADTGLDRIAFTPDGKTAYAFPVEDKGFSTVTRINTATNAVGRPIRVAATAGPIVFTPDGRTAYVGGTNTVTPISTATGIPGTPIHIHGGAVSMAITPDGRTVYVGTGPNCTVVPISTATNTAGKPIRLGGRPPEEMAMAPDGKTLYIANPEGPLGAVVPINTATNTAGKPIDIGLSAEIAITPDGKTLYAAAWKPSNQPKIVSVSTATNTPGKPIVLPVRVSIPLGVLAP
jgi:DNA-binding beta-propeller fold protein YncE